MLRDSHHKSCGVPEHRHLSQTKGNAVRSKVIGKVLSNGGSWNLKEPKMIIDMKSGEVASKFRKINIIT